MTSSSLVSCPVVQALIGVVFFSSKQNQAINIFLFQSIGVLLRNLPRNKTNKQKQKQTANYSLTICIENWPDKIPSAYFMGYFCPSIWNIFLIISQIGNHI